MKASSLNVHIVLGVYVFTCINNIYLLLIYLSSAYMYNTLTHLYIYVRVFCVCVCMCVIVRARNPKIACERSAEKHSKVSL